MTEVHGNCLSEKYGFVWADLCERTGFSAWNVGESHPAKHSLSARVESTRVAAHRVLEVFTIEGESAFFSPNFPALLPENLLEDIASKQNLLDLIQHRIHTLWIWLNCPFHPSCNRTFNNLEPKYKS
jgi:hypothetical protein